MGYRWSVAGILFRIDAVQVLIAAEDHPPPHVHAFHQGEGWRARFRFSFLSDIAALYRFKRRGRRPTEATLDRVLAAVMANLPACRAEWWRTHGSRHGIGLVNRRVETRSIAGGDGFVAKIALSPGKSAVGVVSAAYSPGSRKVTLALADGRRLTLTPGRHIEEAEEWR
jgi:hypothetical protein